MTEIPQELREEQTSRDTSEQIVDLLKSYKYIILILSIAGFLYLTYTETQISVPPRYERYVVQFIFGVAISIIPSRYVLRKLTTDNRIQIHDVEPFSGDVSVHKLTEDQFRELTIVDDDGEEIGTEEMHRISTSTSGLSYEVTNFDEENLEAEVTWWAGLRPREIRSKRKSLDYVRDVYARKADKYDTIRDNLDLVVRDAVDREMTRRMSVEEDILNLDDSSIEKSVSSAMSSLKVDNLSKEKEGDRIEDEVEAELDIEVEEG